MSNPFDIFAPLEAILMRRGVGAWPERELAAFASEPKNALALARAITGSDVALAELAAAAWPHVGDPFALASFRRDAGRMAVTVDPSLPPTLLALNEPELFVEKLCVNRRWVDLPAVQAIEAMRSRCGLGPASLYGPLLDRRLSAEARLFVHQLLGGVPGEGARALLESEERRAESDDTARSARRERMRQRTLQAAFDGPPSDSVAWRISLEAVQQVDWFQPLADGGVVTRIVFTRTKMFHALARFVAAAPVAEVTASMLSVGQLRTLLEEIPSARRQLPGPLWERLDQREAVPFPTVPPVDSAPSPAEERLHRAPWDRLSWPGAKHRWPRVLLEESRSVDAASWPRDAMRPRLAHDLLTEICADRAARAEASQQLVWLSRHLALAGQPLASEVAAEAASLARGRAGPVLWGLVERTLGEELFELAPLPTDFRRDLRERLRRAIGESVVTWRDVDRLNAAQRFLERRCRDAARATGEGLILPDAQLIADAVALVVPEEGQEAKAGEPLLAWNADLPETATQSAAPAKRARRRPRKSS